MGELPAASAPVATIAAMVTPGLLMLVLAVAGTLMLLGGAMGMVMESRLSRDQIADEIHCALTRLQGTEP